MAKRRKAYRNYNERNNENHPCKTMNLLTESRVAVVPFFFRLGSMILNSGCFNSRTALLDKHD